MLKRLFALLVVLALAGCTPGTTTPSATPGTDATGATVAVETPAVRELRVGDCTGALNLSTGSTSPVEPVDCEQPHFYEVFSLVPVESELVPDANALEVIAETRCLPSFLAYVGVKPEYSRYTSLYLVPDPETWLQDPSQRFITCLLGDADGGLVGTARGDMTIFPALGECTGPQDVPPLEVAVLDCESKHHYEVYAERRLDSDEAPTTAELTKLLTRVCVAGFKEFVGVDATKSRYEYAYFIADADLWGNVKDHRLVCSAGSPKGGITGSLEGIKK